MATLAAPFILCPISEIKELVGFSEDAEPNKVIVSLGKNIAIRYSVQEQKQEISWTSSSHWFTSKVVYCQDLRKYAAVIDDNCVGLWSEDDSHLVGLKKYKTSDSLYEVLPSSLGSLLVFKNGRIAPLEEVVLHGRKGDFKGFIDTSAQKIVDVFLDEAKGLAFICSAAQLPDQQGLKATSRIGVEKQSRLTIHTLNLAGNEEQAFTKVSSVVINPGSGFKIIGWCIVNSGVDCKAVYLCSNGTLVVKSLVGKDTGSSGGVETKITGFGKYVSTSNPVVLRAYNESTIICYGSSKNEEGAIVFLYDLKYGLSLSTQTLKLFSTPPIMTTVSNNVLVPLGLNLLVVGIKVSKSLLSSVVGRNQIQGIDFFESRDPWKCGWEQKVIIQPLVKNVRTDDMHESMYDGIDLVDLQGIISSLEKNGHPETLISGQVVPQVLEKGDETALKWILEYFEDIPEKLLVQLIPYALTAFRHGDSDECMDVDIVTKNTGTQPILFGILKRSFDIQEMVKCLKTLTYKDSYSLLHFMTQILSCENPFSDEGKSGSENILFIRKIMVWISAILDAQYTNFVFAGETDLIEKMLKTINDKILLMKEIETLEPLVEMVTSKTRYDPRPNPKSIYRVEKVIFN